MTQNTVLAAQKAYLEARDRVRMQATELARRQLQDAERQLDRAQRLYLLSVTRVAS